MPASYYDEVFRSSQAFNLPFYRSPYYAIWLLIADRLVRDGCSRILEIGCGPGQLAALFHSLGIHHYVGFDFASVGVEKARKLVPGYRFFVGDARDAETYAGIDYDVVVCTEVFEHIERDLDVLGHIQAGKRCLITVPDFPWRSHVRHFDDEAAVVARYGDYFGQLSVTRVKGPRNDTEVFWLIDGVRSQVSASRPQDPHAAPG